MTSPKRDPRDVLRDWDAAVGVRDLDFENTAHDLAAALRSTLDRLRLEEERVRAALAARDDAKLREDQALRGLVRVRDERDQLRARLTQAEAVIEAARRFQVSFAKHYHGYPGKLEWPEIHGLRQTLDAWDSHDAHEKGETP